MQNSTKTFGPMDVLRTLWHYPMRWILPAVAVTVGVTIYAYSRPSTWEVSQAMVVRDTASKESSHAGRFQSGDDMQTIQETILELTGSRSVLETALKSVGPIDEDSSENWPSATAIESLHAAVKVTPPKGAEFGRTEVFYLKVKDQDRDRAMRLASAIVTGLQNRYQQLLDDRAASVVAEIQRTVELATEGVNHATGELTHLESSVGIDLAELRMLHENASGSSDLRQKMISIENELRVATTSLRASRELIALLRTARDNNSSPVSLPAELLRSHSALSKLNDGLTTARLHTSSLLATKTEQHPTVQGARIAELAVLNNLRTELKNSVRIAEVEIRLGSGRVEQLMTLLANTTGRLKRLAGLRAQYAVLLAKTESSTTQLEAARRTLSDALASQAAARTTNLIGLIDSPEAGTQPIGVSRATIVVVGLVGGLFVGWGILFLTVSPSTLGAETAGPNDFASRRRKHKQTSDESSLEANTDGLFFSEKPLADSKSTQIYPMVGPQGNTWN